MSTDLTYPRRPRFFAHRVTRLAFKTCLAQEIGPTATMLVIFVAHTEDAKHYSAPPTFYNEQLLPILGLRKWEALDRARRAAVAAGWLHYQAPPSGARRPGLYWSLIPDRFSKIDDQPSDEHSDHIRQTGTVKTEAYPANGYGGGDGGGYGRGYGEGDAGGEPSIPVPDPVCSARTTKRTTRFVPPSLEEVTAYCRQRKNHVDPHHFVDYHEARGWKLKGGQQVKDWMACVRTWERNGFSSGNGAASKTPSEPPPAKTLN